MARMASVDWQRVVADDCALPAGEPLDELSAELTRMLGSPDPRERDGVAYPVLATWIDRGVYDDLLTGLGDGMVVGLTRGLGESGTDSVFRRSFSALALAACLDRANRLDLVPAGKVLEWGDRLASWYVRERDVRGFVAGKGWAHAVAHGADGLGVLAASRHLGAPELTAVLDTLADRVLVPGGTWVHGEPDRVALATLRYFADKSELYAAVGQWGARLVTERLVPPLASDRPVRERTAEAVEAYLRTIEEHPQVFLLLVRHRGTDTDPLADGRGAIAALIARILGDTLRDLDVDAAGAEPWAHGLVGLGLSTGEWWFERRTMSRAAVARYLTAFVWHAFSGIAEEYGVPLSVLDSPAPSPTPIRKESS